MGPHRLKSIFKSRCGLEQQYEITRDGEPAGRMLCAIARAGIGWQALTVVNAGGSNFRLTDKTRTRYDAGRVRRRQRQAALNMLDEEKLSGSDG